MAGCYYELLRTFIPDGGTLRQEDGFLVHECECSVTLTSDIWSHNLTCQRTVDDNQKITAPPDQGESVSLQCLCIIVSPLSNDLFLSADATTGIISYRIL